MVEIRTVSKAHTVEVDRVKGSRFIADIAPTIDEQAALAFVDRIRSREQAATHHCWAYRLAGGRARSSDDGEPRDTAGPPILRRIGGADLSDVVVVVTRYYGGTNLGRGGLIRAYGSAASEVLATADVVVRRVRRTLGLDHSYDLSGPVESVLAAFDARVLSADYGELVSLRVAVPVELEDGFVAAIGEASAGTVRPAAID